MSFKVALSSTLAAQVRELPKATQKRIRDALAARAEDPRTPRPRADIKPLKATDPPKHRIRVGTYRLVYRIEGKRVLVIDVFSRERGYRE